MRKWLREMRTEMGFTGADLGAALGISASEVSFLENGHRKANGLTVGQIVKIAALMKETPEAILRKEMEYLGANH